MRNIKVLSCGSAGMAMGVCPHLPGSLSIYPSDAVRTGYPATFTFSPDIPVSWETHWATALYEPAAKYLAATQSSTTTFQSPPSPKRQ